ncbi:MAG: YeeE/YedE family protein [Proteobacteria bacterium]|nr:YeeE/YedE family protein [Pseudomonadota bacterium]
MPGENPRYWNPYFGGLMLGLVLFAAFFVTGHGLGSSGGTARLVAAAEQRVAPRHVARTPAVAEFMRGAGGPLDHWIVWSIGGVLLGGLTSGLLRRRVRLETFHGPRITARVRWIAALVGGALVGYAARLARGCTSGQGLSGGATLAVGSWIFLFACFAGAYGCAFFVRRLWTPGREEG